MNIAHPCTANIYPFNSQGHALSHGPLQQARPLRVLQVKETGHAATEVGYLRISGRMADVCAELDRLVLRAARMQ